MTKKTLRSWEEVVDLMDEDALRDTYDDMSWVDGDINGMLQAYAVHHKARTGQDWNVEYVAE
jgi:hypothetical protein